MRRIVLACLLLACDRQKPSPEPVVAPVDAPVDATTAPTASALATASATPNVVPTATVTPPEKLPPQTTTCKTDDDCVLTSYQSGCCVQACGAYATNAKRLAEIEAIENCAAVRPTKVCPPPAPCPPQKQIAKKAVCRKGTCDVVY